MNYDLETLFSIKCKHLFKQGNCSRCAIPPVHVKSWIEEHGGVDGSPCGDQFCDAIDLYLGGLLEIKQLFAVMGSKRIIPIL